jgi:biopolymer transport protein TolR
MAFSFDQGEDDSPLADINVTPLVDVMLVLLIIFMVTAPMLHQGIEVALPRADAQNLPPRVDDPLIISINRDGMVFLRDAPVHASLLMERLTPMLKSRGDDSVYLKGDRDVPYGVVVEVLDILHRGGVENVGMVTEKPPGAGAHPARR